MYSERLLLFETVGPAWVFEWLANATSQSPGHCNSISKNSKQITSQVILLTLLRVISSLACFRQRFKPSKREALIIMRWRLDFLYRSLLKLRLAFEMTEIARFALYARKPALIAFPGLTRGSTKQIAEITITAFNTILSPSWQAPMRQQSIGWLRSCISLCLVPIFPDNEKDSCFPKIQAAFLLL